MRQTVLQDILLIQYPGSHAGEYTTVFCFSAKSWYPVIFYELRSCTFTVLHAARGK